MEPAVGIPEPRWNSPHAEWYHMVYPPSSATMKGLETVAFPGLIESRPLRLIAAPVNGPSGLDAVATPVFHSGAAGLVGSDEIGQEAW